MKSKQKRVLTVGVFDIFHLGHLNVLEAAKMHGDILVAAVHDDKLNTKGVDFFYTLDERIRLVKSLRVVDEVVSYERVDLLVKEIEFDVFAHGPDQNHSYFQEAFRWSKANGKEVITLERTKGISSTNLRDVLRFREI